MKRHSTLLLVFLFPIFSAGQSADAPKQTLAVIDGQAINEDDLAPSVAGQLRPLREQEYQIKRKALEGLIDQKLIEAQAKKKGVSTEKLYQQEVDAKIAEPTEAELTAIYTVQREQLNHPLEEVRGQLQQTLKKARIQQGRQDYSAHLREQAKIVVLLSPPRVQVGFDSARVRTAVNKTRRE